uniref:RRM domain-containing protein n=1 Tax=Romanomermis culicivorax TaxID=13658 RepID=A0A915K731_ROMCU
MPPSGYESTRVVQISNVSPSASREQLYHMFGYFGHIDEMKVFPSETSPLFASATSKLCFIKYDEYDSVDAAQHMTNTVFIDRALVCVPVIENKIPEEETAMKVGAPALGGQRQLPPNLMNQIQVVGSQQLMVTIDPSLAALGLPPYPPLPANTDAVKMEEIRRTVYVGNIPRDAKPKEISTICEWLVMTTATHTSNLPTNIRIQHSTVAIIKPLVKTIDMAKKEVEDALKNAEATNPTLGKGMDVDEVLRRFTSSSPLIAKSPRSPNHEVAVLDYDLEADRNRDMRALETLAADDLDPVAKLGLHAGDIAPNPDHVIGVVVAANEVTVEVEIQRQRRPLYFKQPSTFAFKIERKEK